MKILIFAKNAHSSSTPGAGYFNSPLWSNPALNCFTAAAQDSIKRLDPMDSIPEQVRMMRLKLARTIRLSICYSTCQCAILSGPSRLGKAQCGRTEYWNPGFLRQVKDFNDVVQ